MKPIIPEGGYFMLADWSSLGEILPDWHIARNRQNNKFYVFLLNSEPYVDLSEKKYPQKDYCFVEWLTRVKKLAGIPPSAFYSAENKSLGESNIRFCFIKVPACFFHVCFIHEDCLTIGFFFLVSRRKIPI